jgi:molybdopterin-containing oxidoreductase family iron-sulfur binding subunit
VVLGGNPVHDAPAELDFAAALAGIPFRVHLASHFDETSALCHWHLPEAHALERWSDARAHDGTLSIVQPLIAPLHDGGKQSAHELVALLAGESAKSAYELLRAHWQAASGKEGAEFERFWRTALHDGVVAGSAFPPLDVTAGALELGPAPRGPRRPRARGSRCAPTLGSSTGASRTNAWLQELPRPITRLVWDNAALVSPATARELGLESADVVAIELEGRSVRAPAWIVPGHADGTLTLHLGYGRTRAGELGSGVGFDAYRLRSAGSPWRASGARVTRTGERHPLATVQKQPDQEGRALARVATFDRFRAEGAHAFIAAAQAHGELAPPSLYPDYPYEGHAWGMVIDLNACIGCNACMVACQAENNVPVVGKEQVLIGRELHWLRIDRYFEPGGDVVHQPVPCMHCEHAPCEVVCPVGATVHSSEGLNEMVYNRCVGTRYCSNNCPYKVRRFNFLAYADFRDRVAEARAQPGRHGALARA